jgi:hypothetical protein
MGTLDPKRLTPGDWLDLRGRKWPSFGWQDPQLSVVIGYRSTHWPSHATGFLYFHRPPSASHPAAGSLRFRLSKSPDDLERAFGPEGEDLRDGIAEWSAMPWSIPLLTLHLQRYAPVLRQLLADGFVTPKGSEALDGMLVGIRESTKTLRLSRVLDEVTEPWVLDLDAFKFRLVALAEDGVHYVNMRDLTMTEGGRRKVEGKQGNRIACTPSFMDRLTLCGT